MIGQKFVLETIDGYIANDNFARFTIITGPTGCGKKTLCKHICRCLHANSYFVENSVDAVREVISTAYSCIGVPVCFIFSDADKMSLAAKNALLKLCEEPPKNAYVILTLQDIENTLPTIVSRGRVIQMATYYGHELREYFDSKYSDKPDSFYVVSRVCATPGDIDIVMSYGAEDFYRYVEKVFDNICVVNGANAFKIASNVKLKESDDSSKYDLGLFFHAFNAICVDHICSSKDANLVQKYYSMINCTTRMFSKLKIVGINKQMLIDDWILTIRKVGIN